MDPEKAMVVMSAQRGPGDRILRWSGWAMGMMGLLSLVGTSVGASAPPPPREAPSASRDAGSPPLGDAASGDAGSPPGDGGAVPDLGRPSRDALPEVSETGMDTGMTAAPADAPPARGDTLPAQATPAPVTLASPAADTTAPSAHRFGVGLDLGLSGPLPDLGLTAIYRPREWFNLNLGAGFNGIAPGLRGGATLLNPFVVPLSLAWEAGHYFAGNANGYARRLASTAQPIASLRSFSYSYMNLMGGVEYRSAHFGAYLRVGVSWMRATLVDFEDSLRPLTPLEVRADDAHVAYRGPTARLGTYVLF